MEIRKRPLRILIATVIVILAFAGGFRFFAKRNSDKPADYKTATVERGNVTMTVTATGTLSAVTTVQVGSQVSGMISRLYADFNSPVRKGQLLVELDPTPFEAQLEQRRADLQRSEVELRNAKLQLDRQVRLVESGLSPDAELDSARALYDSSRAQVNLSSASVRQAATNLKYTKILSPIDGVVADRQYDVGQTVAASFQAPTLFTIAQDLTKMQAQADVDQSDIGRVKIGQAARFTVDAYPDEVFVGTIAQIRLNAATNQNVVTYPVIIQVANPDQKLRPQMTANVTIEVATVSDVLRLPNAALRFKPEEEGEGSEGGAREGQGSQPATERATAEQGRGGRGLQRLSGAFPGGKSAARRRGQTVYQLENGKPKAVEIRTGITDGRFTQIVEGALKAGDPVVVGKATTRVEQQGRGPRMGGGRF